jgi:hypothetical protein
MNNITFNNILYNIHIVNEQNYELYEKKLDKMYICDNKIISKGYENLSYSSLSEDGYIGFFISNTNNSIIYSSLIVDLNCSQISNKIDENVDNSVEIVLLCSDTKNRVKNLTTYFFNYIINNVINQYKPNVNNILLYVSKGDSNQHAINFYNKNGFESIENNIMKYSYSGGKNKSMKKSMKKLIEKYKNKLNKSTKKYKNKFKKSMKKYKNKSTKKCRRYKLKKK